MKTIAFFASAATLLLASAAYAHSLRIECKKMTSDMVICRGVFSDGELARRLPVILLDDEERVIARGMTDVKGEYSFAAPGPEYNVVIEGNKAHVASMSSLDIW